MNIKRLFGSRPRFQLGDHVASLDSSVEVNYDVAQLISCGIVTGIRFCSEGSMYVGWTYDMQIYKTISGTVSNYIISRYPNLYYYEAAENDLYVYDKEVDILKIINALALKHSKHIEENSR